MLATNSKYIMPIIDNSILIDLIVHFDRAINLIQNSNKQQKYVGINLTRKAQILYEEND